MNKIASYSAAAIGALVMMTSSAQAAGITFFAASCNGIAVNNDCSLTLDDGTALTLSNNGGALPVNTFGGVQGLGLGFDETTIGSGNSLFPNSLTIQFDADVTWIGGQFAQVESGAGVTIERLSDGANSVFVFDDIEDFNTGASNNAAGQGPNSVSTEANGGADFDTLISNLDAAEAYSGGYTLSYFFEANTLYTLTTIPSFGTSSNSFYSFHTMNFEEGDTTPTTASVPLPATGFLLLGALGLIGWRARRAA